MRFDVKSSSELQADEDVISRRGSYMSYFVRLSNDTNSFSTFVPMTI